MNCKNCGSELEEGAKFCGKCGTEIKEINLSSMDKNKDKKNIIMPIVIVFGLIIIATVIISNSIDKKTNYVNDNNNWYNEDSYYEDSYYEESNYENSNSLDDSYEYEEFHNPVGKETLQYPSQNDIFKYDVYETYVEITGYIGNDITGDLIIPDEIDDLPVRSIGKEAFGVEQGMYIVTGSSISSVVIPDTVYNIGDFAFAQCELLESVDFGNSVVSIGLSAFEQTAVKSINLPDSLTKLRHRIFKSCKNLQSVTIGDGLAFVSDEMFCSCSKLKEINWGANITQIGISAFERTGFSKIKLPDTVTEIYAGAFSHIKNLEEFIFSDKIEMVEAFALSDCPNLKKVDIGRGLISLPENLFNNSTNIQELIIPGNVTKINSNVFGGEYAGGGAKPTIYGEKGSEAASFASKKGLAFKLIEN